MIVVPISAKLLFSVAKLIATHRVPRAAAVVLFDSVRVVYVTAPRQALKTTGSPDNPARELPLEIPKRLRGTTRDPVEFHDRHKESLQLRTVLVAGPVTAASAGGAVAVRAGPLVCRSRSTIGINRGRGNHEEETHR